MFADGNGRHMALIFSGVGREEGLPYSLETAVQCVAGAATCSELPGILIFTIGEVIYSGIFRFYSAAKVTCFRSSKKGPGAAN